NALPLKHSSSAHQRVNDCRGVGLQVRIIRRKALATVRVVYFECGSPRSAERFATFDLNHRKEGFVAWYFIFFFISGFCSVLYELIWLRLSMAQFGVTTAMVSIVLSVFMAGLGLGSWASGV